MAKKIKALTKSDILAMLVKRINSPATPTMTQNDVDRLSKLGISVIAFTQKDSQKPKN